MERGDSPAHSYVLAVFLAPLHTLQLLFQISLSICASPPSSINQFIYLPTCLSHWLTHSITQFPSAPISELARRRIQAHTFIASSRSRRRRWAGLYVDSLNITQLKQLSDLCQVRVPRIHACPCPGHAPSRCGVVDADRSPSRFVECVCHPDVPKIEHNP